MTRIDHETVKMADLCRDLKKSRCSKELVVDSKIIQIQSPTEIPSPVSSAPQVRVVNGQIVIDESSLQVDRTQRDADPSRHLEYIEESSKNRRVTCLTWGKQLKNDKWDAESTVLFYEGLNLWGTDFEMISRMFPNRNRRNIRNKFNNEERKNPSRITLALRTRKPVDMDEYSRRTGTTFRSIPEMENDLEKLRNDFYSNRRENQQAAQRLLEESNRNTAKMDEEIIGQIECMD